MKKVAYFFTLFIVVALFASACNLPANNPQQGTATVVAQTVEAVLSATATETPVAATPTSEETSTPLPLPDTATPAFTATPVCPQAQFITDVTIPDGTIMTPAQAFTKKWRIRNTGQCAWNGYSLIFDAGDSMGGPASQAIGAINPGQEIDLEINLTAPSAPGNYRGYWRIVTNNNVLVPILNGYQGRAFYVDIKVQAPPSATPLAIPAPINNPTIAIKQCLPAAPPNVNYIGILNWEDKSNNETGFNIYIDGVLSGSVAANTTTFDIPNSVHPSGTVVEIGVESYNAVGKAPIKKVNFICP